ncbi:MAG TPA: dihydrofolate reductase family protein [Thermoplasmata archaeon]|jgi:dihydrofolate reductase|nr:dihydrofolate reductase family protein [Thermoplasmata archaeon]
MWNLLTLDGYFEGRKNWDIDFHNTVWGEELERLSIQQSKDIGALLFGRVTYQGMASFWPKEKGEIADFMNSVPKVVFSRTMQKAEWNNSRLVRGNAEEEVSKMKRQPGKDLFVFGSANLSAALTRAGLIDEYRLCLAPVVLGGGAPLFKDNPAPLRLKLVEARPLKSGGVVLRYKREGATTT